MTVTINGTAGITTPSENYPGSVSGTVTVQPATAAGTWTLTLPTTPGTSGYVLSTNGSGVTSWIANGSGSMVYPGVGIANSTGSAWGTSYGVTGTGTTVVLSATPTLTGTITSGAYLANETITGVLNQGAFAYGTLGYSDTNIFSSYMSSVNSYNQKILQNTNSGAAASTNMIVSNNNGTSTTYFGEFGMNSSGFTGSGAFNAPNAVYLDSTSADLAIGTTTLNAVHFVVNGSATDAMTISPAGAVTSNQAFNLNVAVTVASNAGTVPVTSRLNTFTNSSAATMAITMATGAAATTAASGTGTVATLTFSGSYVYPVGSTVTVAGVTPTGYNGAYTVTASSAGSVSYANTTTGAQTVAGTVTNVIDGQMSMVRIYDFSAATQTIGWTNTENSTASVPTTSNGSTTLPVTVGFQYNGQTSKWRCIATA